MQFTSLPIEPHVSEHVPELIKLEQDTDYKSRMGMQEAERQLLGLLGEQTAAALEARSAVAGIKALRARLAERRSAVARMQDDLARTQLETSKAELCDQSSR